MQFSENFVDTGVPLGGKGCLFRFILNFLIEVVNKAKY